MEQEKTILPGRGNYTKDNQFKDHVKKVLKEKGIPEAISIFKERFGGGKIRTFYNWIHEIDRTQKRHGHCYLKNREEEIELIDKLRSLTDIWSPNHPLFQNTVSEFIVSKNGPKKIRISKKWFQNFRSNHLEYIMKSFKRVRFSKSVRAVQASLDEKAKRERLQDELKNNEEISYSSGFDTSSEITQTVTNQQQYKQKQNEDSIIQNQNFQQNFSIQNTQTQSQEQAMNDNQKTRKNQEYINLNFTPIKSDSTVKVFKITKNSKRIKKKRGPIHQKPNYSQIQPENQINHPQVFPMLAPPIPMLTPIGLVIPYTHFDPNSQEFLELMRMLDNHLFQPQQQPQYKQQMQYQEEEIKIKMEEE